MNDVLTEREGALCVVVVAVEFSLALHNAHGRKSCAVKDCARKLISGFPCLRRDAAVSRVGARDLALRHCGKNDGRKHYDAKYGVE